MKLVSKAGGPPPSYPIGYLAPVTGFGTLGKEITLEVLNKSGANADVTFSGWNWVSTTWTNPLANNAARSARFYWDNQRGWVQITEWLTK